MKTTSAQRRKELYNLLGDLPQRKAPIRCRTISVQRTPKYILEKLMLDLNGIEQVPAYFVRPLEAAGPMPAVLYNHAHGGDYVLGKDELTCGRGAVQSPPYAEELTAMGCCALCIDHWAFGERRGRTESEIFKTMLWQGQVMWGMMVFDSLRAVDYLCTRADVDARRIGTVGLSMGSTMGWWAAALNERIRVCVDICCLTDFHEIIKSGGLDGHGIYYYVPRLLKHFSTSDINALIAPRAHLGLAGNYDRLTPPAGLDKIDRDLRRAYKAAGAPDAWQMVRYDIGHLETADMRMRIVAWLKKWL
jgi:dienelactone hydrolase